MHAWFSYDLWHVDVLISIQDIFWFLRCFLCIFFILYRFFILFLFFKSIMRNTLIVLKYLLFHEFMLLTCMREPNNFRVFFVNVRSVIIVISNFFFRLDKLSNVNSCRIREIFQVSSQFFQIVTQILTLFQYFVKLTDFLFLFLFLLLLFLCL